MLNNDKMATTSTTLKSRFEPYFTPIALRSYLAEFISTFFYVFVAVGSTMSSRKLMPDATSDPSSLVVVAIANAFALSTAVYVASSVSGGHINPAVTFGRAVGGHISIPSAMLYWVSQLVASTIACLLLKVTMVGQHVPGFIIAEQMMGFGASIIEGVVTFSLVYTVYVAADTNQTQLAAIGPMMIGLIAGANVLATGPSSGGSMNPACAFGASLIGGSFRNQAVYWVGPLIGAGLAGLVYENVMFPTEAPDSFRGISAGAVRVGA